MTRTEIQVFANKYNLLHKDDDWFVVSMPSRTNEGTGDQCLRIIVKKPEDASRIDKKELDGILIEVTIASETALF